MLREMGNSQNAQITYMQGCLGEQGYGLMAAQYAKDEVGDDNDVLGYAIGIIAVLRVP